MVTSVRARTHTRVSPLRISNGADVAALVDSSLHVVGE